MSVAKGKSHLKFVADWPIIVMALTSRCGN